MSRRDEPNDDSGYGASAGSVSQLGGSAFQPSSQPTYAKPPPLTLEQSLATARTHFDALRSWLSARENGLATNSSRSNAREKLTRLTRQQFQELSTDVYDELVRRVEDAAGRAGSEPYLPVRNEFHPKRNQARQKLATLPLQRFRDLASDVYFELERRYPDFAMDERPASPSYPAPVSGLASRSRDGSISHLPASATAPLRRAPTPTSTSNGNLSNPASNDVVVPNKSTFIMEDAAAPGGNYGPGTASGRGQGDVSPTYDPNDRSYGAGSSNSHQALGNSESHGNSHEGTRGISGRASEASSIGTRFMANYAGSAGASDTGGRRSWDNEEIEKLKSDYEYKITLMSKRISELERENEDARDVMMGKANDTARARELETQVRTHRERYDSQSAAHQKLLSDFDALQSTHSRSINSNESSSRVRQELEQLTLEFTASEASVDELRGEVSGLVDELRSVNSRYEELLEGSEREGGERREMEEQIRLWRKKYEGAKTELRNIKATSQLFVGSTIKFDGDHMPASADGVIADIHVSAFQTSIDDLLAAARSKEPSAVLPAMRAVVGAVEHIDQDIQAVEPRRIASLPGAEQERLQSLKAKANATLSNLMTASKNHAMSFGVSPVSLLDAAASHLSSTIVDLIRILRIRRTAGTSTGRAAEPRFDAPARGNGIPNISSLNSARGVPARDHHPEIISPQLRSGGPPYTTASTSRIDERAYASPPDSDRQHELDDDSRYRRAPSPSYGQPTLSHSQNIDSDPRDRYGGPSPLAPTPNQGYMSDSRSRDASYEQQQGGYGSHVRAGSVLTYGSPNPSHLDGAELKSYLEGQTEAIVHSIQALLSAIRSGAHGGQLHENLTQIITIVSSIVAITKDALPAGARAEGDDILRDLADNCGKLSEMQAQSSQDSTQIFNKQTKQSMASASFGVAKSLKSLNALFV